MTLSNSKYFSFKLSTTLPNDYLQKIFIEHGCTDEDFYQWTKKNVGQGWTIYDIGANIFEYTEILARQTGPSGTVYSFEPQKNLVDNYKAAQKENDYSNAAKINIFNFGLGIEDKKTVLMVNPNNLGGSSMNEYFLNFYSQKRSIDNVRLQPQIIRIKRADSLELPPIVPDLIKIDIEGNEWSAWQGFPDFLKRAKIILAELGGYTELELIEEYMGHGRLPYDLDDMPMQYTAKELKKILEDNSHRQYNIVFR